MNIKFHCSEEGNFNKQNQFVRAFTYTDYSIEPHNHDFYEMNIVLGGTGVHQIESESFHVKIGDVFVIPPMIVHAYFNTENLEVYHILFKKNFVRKNELESGRFPGYLKLMEIEPFLRQNCSDAMFLHLTSSQIVEIQNDLKFIERNTEFDEINLLPLHQHTAWKLIYYLAYLLEKQTANEQKGIKTNYRNQILDTLEYLNRHFSEKITITDLSKRVYLTRSTFLRSFHSVCGCTPMEYLNQYRVQKAIELLELTTMSKTEVAHACGFYDLSHMERSIKKLKR